MSFQLPQRPRRLRNSAPNRGLQRETRLHPSQLICPMFVCGGEGRKEPIDSLPGQFRYSGVQTVNLFAAGAPKSPLGEAAADPDGMVPRAVRALKEALPDLNVQTDVALDPYTTHGHDGVVIDGRVDNDASIEHLQQMALAHARERGHRNVTAILETVALLDAAAGPSVSSPGSGPDPAIGRRSDGIHRPLPAEGGPISGARELSHPAPSF